MNKKTAEWVWYKDPVNKQEGIECSNCRFRPKYKDFIKRRMMENKDIIPVETNYEASDKCPVCYSRMKDISESFRKIAEAEYKENGELSERTRAYDIDVLKLSPRVSNALKRRDYFTIQDILTLTRKIMMRIPSFGKKSYEELEEALKQYGYIAPNKYEELVPWQSIKEIRSYNDKEE
jgi:DNA-directed RNA polymerase alpha subunit